MKILILRSKNFKKIVKIAEKSIKEGKILICPTDTVYGLIADATNKKAVKKVFQIKKRSFKKPIPIFVKDIKTAKRITKVDKKQEKLLKKYWPGKVTVILKPKRKFPKGIGKPKAEIGLRIPNYKIINQLLLTFGRPLTGTSANISGKIASTKIKEIINQFRDQKYQPDLVIDAGNLTKNKPSIIIDLINSRSKVLRS